MWFYLEKELGNIHSVPRELFEAREVAGSAIYKQKLNCMKLCFTLRSACSSSPENNLFIFFF